MQDAQLVGAASAGDSAAFAEIYDRYADRVHGFCWSLTRNADDAADLTQDVFLLAGERIGQLRDPTKLRAWLFAIARHEVYKRTKQRSRSEPTDVGAEVASLQAGPERLAEQADTTALVWDAAAGLSDRDRALLELHLRQGLDGAELADALGVAPSHVYVLLTRMRDQVERSLGALVVARAGRRDCDELRQLLSSWDGTLSPLIRKRVARHIDGCEVCSRRRRALVNPLSLLSAEAAPFSPTPISVRRKVLDRVRLGSQTRTAGWQPNGFPPADRVRRRRPWLVAAALAALVALGAGVGVAVSGQPRGSHVAALGQPTNPTTTDAGPRTTLAPWGGGDPGPTSTGVPSTSSPHAHSSGSTERTASPSTVGRTVPPTSPTTPTSTTLPVPPGLTLVGVQASVSGGQACTLHVTATVTGPSDTTVAGAAHVGGAALPFALHRAGGSTWTGSTNVPFGADGTVSVTASSVSANRSAGPTAVAYDGCS